MNAPPPGPGAASHGPSPQQIGCNLSKLKEEIKNITARKKQCQTEYDNIESQAVELMLKANKAVIAAGPQGPYFMLGKHRQDGSWKSERYRDFFRILIAMIRAGKVINEHHATKFAHEYLHRFEKRKIVLKKHKTLQEPKDSIQDLVNWRNFADRRGGAEPGPPSGAVGPAPGNNTVFPMRA